MRAFHRLLAVPSSVGTQSSGLKPVPTALLPPIPLYRRLLRAHRKHLSHDMRVLGDEYIKSEFRAHKSVENPVHIVGFLTEWQTYVQQIEGEAWRGERMDRGKVDKMSGMFFPRFEGADCGVGSGVTCSADLRLRREDEQIAQMYELMNAIRERELAENDPEFDPTKGKE